MGTEALLEIVRWTARLSGALFLASLFAAGVRPGLRPRLFLAFAIAHGVHFAFVAAYAHATALASLDGGVARSAVQALVFVAAGVGLVVASFRGRPAFVVHGATGLFAVGFVVAWGERVASRPLYALPLAALAAGLAAYTRSALASRRGIP